MRLTSGTATCKSDRVIGLGGPHEFPSPGMVGEEGWTAPVEAGFLTEVASQAV